jgi:hypothetical protein
MTSEAQRRRRLPSPTPWLVVALAAAGLARAGRARADDGADEHGATQGLIADAVAEYDAGRFEEARALFRRAQAETPSARTLRGIGMASFELRDYVEATRALAAALSEQRHALTPDQHQHVATLLARAETFVGRFTLKLAPPDASLMVDGKPVLREPDGTVLLSFGRHLAVASCPGCAPVERTIDVLGGERQVVEIALATPSQSKGPAPPVGPVGGGPAGDRDTEGGVVPRVLLVSALVAGAGTVAAALWWHERANELGTCRAAGDRCLNEPTVAQQTDLATGTTLGLGAVTVAAGIAAAILWSHRTPPGGRSVACVAAREGVSCAIPF